MEEISIFPSVDIRENAASRQNRRKRKLQATARYNLGTRQKTQYDKDCISDRNYLFVIVYLSVCRTHWALHVIIHRSSI